MTRDPSAPPTDPDNGRILSLSDAVFAFAMTLMVITIDVPNISNIPPEKVSEAVRDQIPHFFSAALSFMVIGIYWIAHHRTFEYIKGHDAGVMWLNIVFLFSIAFLPFPTDLQGEYHTRFTVIFYAASMTVCSLLLGALWLYVSRDRRLVHEHVSPQVIRYITLRSLVVPCVSLLSIVLAFVNTSAAEYSWLLMIPAMRLIARRYGGIAD